MSSLAIFMIISSCSRTEQRKLWKRCKNYRIPRDDVGANNHSCYVWVVDCDCLNLQSAVESVVPRGRWMVSTTTWPCACTLQSYHALCWCTIKCLMHAISTLLIPVTLCFAVFGMLHVMHIFSHVLELLILDVICKALLMRANFCMLYFYFKHIKFMFYCLFD